MRLTRFSDNALRCLMFLGINPGETITVAEIASRMAVSEDHLLKVVRRLSELGYVRSVRGRRGGVQLIRDAGDVNIAEVVRATEENLAIVPCFDPDSHACPIAPVCGLAPAIDEALAAFFRVLEGYTLADLVKHRRALAALV